MQINGQSERDSDATARAGGLSLALGSAIFICTITAFMTLFGAPEASGEGGAITIADQGRHLLDNASVAWAIWVVEAFAVMLLALAGFSLSRRPAAQGSLAPLGWLAVGMGSTMYVTTYAVLLGAYWPAAEVVDTMPVLLDAANQTAVAIFLMANIPINAGFAIVFFVEARLDAKVLPRPLAWTGCLLASVAALVPAYALATAGGMQVALAAAPLGGVLFILLIGYGLRLFMRS